MVFLTGATGFIGSAVLHRLIEEGHEVAALVRSPEDAAVVEAAGARPVIGDATDGDLVRVTTAGSDGVIHAASPGDETSAAFDRGVVDAVLEGLAGSEKPFVYTDGMWTFGAGVLSEDSPLNPVALSAWRPALHTKVRGVSGVRTAVIVPGVVYGYGKGLPRHVADSPRTSGENPSFRMIGDGEQHWAVVHVDDLAALYVLAFEQADAGAMYLASNGTNPTVRELSIAASRAAGMEGRVAAESAEETRARLGEALADALMLDQQASGTAAKIDFGWEPNGPSLLDELATGSYVRR